MAKKKKAVSPVNNSIIFISILLVSIFVGIFYFAQTISIETDFPNKEGTDADVQVGLRIEEVNGYDLTDRFSSLVDLWEKDYVYQFNTPLVLVSLDYIYISPDYISTNKLCFQELSILNQEIEDTDYQNLLNREICAESEINYFIDQSTDFVVLLYDKFESDYIDPYFYPFDRRAIDFSLLTKALMKNENNEEIDTLPTPVVDVAITTQKSSRYVWEIDAVDVENDANNLRITLLHPLIYKIFAGLILFAMWIAIISLPFSSEDKNFWEVTIGIFGLWGIQGILLPENIRGHALVADLILYLYLLLSFTIIFIFVRSMIKDWKEKYK